MTLANARDWKPKFIDKLRRTGNISAACHAAKISRAWAYEERKSDAAFAAQWNDALEEACDALELEARQRATKGAKRPVYSKGEFVDWVYEPSDALIMFLLKAHRPEKYRENFDARIFHTPVPEDFDVNEWRAKRKERLDAIAKREGGSSE